MGWLDWIRETAGSVTRFIEEQYSGVIELAEEIRPVIFPRPATQEAIEEILEEMVTTERFIQEIIPDEARRLARGVRFYEPLKNVARMRHWTVAAPEDIPPSSDYQISIRRVIVGPDGKMTHVDVSFPVGEAYTEDEMIRRAASALEDDFVAEYDIGRSALVRQYTLTQEAYIQRFKPL